MGYRACPGHPRVHTHMLMHHIERPLSKGEVLHPSRPVGMRDASRWAGDVRVSGGRGCWCAWSPGPPLYGGRGIPPPQQGGGPVVGPALEGAGAASPPKGWGPVLGGRESRRNVVRSGTAPEGAGRRPGVRDQFRNGWSILPLRSYTDPNRSDPNHSDCNRPDCNRSDCNRSDCTRSSRGCNRSPILQP